MVDLSFDSKTDFDWFEDRCVELLTHSDGSVCALAATCLSHTARFKGALEEKTVAALRALENDPLIGGQVSDALDDWEQFAGADASRKNEGWRLLDGVRSSSSARGQRY